MTVAPTPLHGQAPHRHWLLAAGAFALVVAGIAIGLLIHGDVADRSSGVGVEGSGVPATESRDVAPFAAVDLAGSNNVTIHVGGEQSVVVSADDNLLDHVTTTVEGGKLVIGTTPGSMATKAPMSVDVTVPTLRALTLSGSGTVVADGIDAKRLTVALPGSGILRANGTERRSRSSTPARAMRSSRGSPRRMSTRCSAAPAASSSRRPSLSTRRCRGAGRSSTAAIRRR